ncbi:MAG: hypothetical protein MUO99_03650, partial [Dehalococcoidales bacterium]|nr:hypothetical protein [Dehalococcoidales bacterium]
PSYNFVSIVSSPRGSLQALPYRVMVVITQLSIMYNPVYGSGYEIHPHPVVRSPAGPDSTPAYVLPEIQDEPPRDALLA